MAARFYRQSEVETLWAMWDGKARTAAEIAERRMSTSTANPSAQRGFTLRILKRFVDEGMVEQTDGLFRLSKEHPRVQRFAKELQEYRTRFALAD